MTIQRVKHLNRIAILSLVGSLLPANSYAARITTPGQASPAACQTAGYFFGDARARTPMPESCIKLVRTMALPSARRMTADATIRAAGYRNILVVEQLMNGKLVRWIISGKQSRLENIKAVDVSEDRKEIYVLDSQAKSVFVFLLGRGGNIGPIRRWENPEFENATGIAADAEGSTLYVSQMSPARITSYSIQADQNGRIPQAQTEPRARFQFEDAGIRLVQDITIDPSRREAWVLDSENQQIHVVALSPGGATLELKRQIFSPSSKLRGAQALRYDQRSDEIRVIYPNDVQLAYSPGASGNTDPHSASRKVATPAKKQSPAVGSH